MPSQLCCRIRLRINTIMIITTMNTVTTTMTITTGMITTTVMTTTAKIMDMGTASRMLVAKNDRA